MTISTVSLGEVGKVVVGKYSPTESKRKHRCIPGLSTHGTPQIKISQIQDIIKITQRNKEINL